MLDSKNFSRENASQVLTPPGVKIRKAFVNLLRDFRVDCNWIIKITAEGRKVWCSMSDR